MAIDPEITRNVELVRNATYGKDVREAIARGLELCYGYTSGETADEAAQRANAAAEAVESLIDDSQQAVHDVQEALLDLDHIVEVSQDTPTYSTNKIWIQPQDNTEYKVASFAAYETLWSRMNEINSVYEQGHGGIVSIAEDPDYVNPNDDLERRYIITYSDETVGEFFVNDGPTGAVGPIDQIVGTDVYYYKVASGSFSPTPPTSGWSSNLPALSPGDYLWTQTRITYDSGAQAYIYGLTRMGLNGADGRDGIDGTGAVNSVAIGQTGTPMAGDIKLPIDAEPTSGSNNLVTSGVVYEALQSAGSLDSPAFTGTPTAPTADIGDSSTQIATTEFVQQAISSKTVTAKQISLTMNDATLTYIDEAITENTAVVAFTNLDYSKLPSSIRWSTLDGELTISIPVAPAESITFNVILMDADGSNE